MSRTYRLLKWKAVCDDDAVPASAKLLGEGNNAREEETERLYSSQNTDSTAIFCLVVALSHEEGDT